MTKEGKKKERLGKLKKMKIEEGKDEKERLVKEKKRRD